MDRKLFGLFSGAQLTAMAIAAIFTPGIVTAAVTYSNVSVVNPTTGAYAFVDASHRLYTYDPIAGYTNNPADLVVLAGNCTANSTKNIFTVPTGKALIVKAMHMAYSDGTAGFRNYAYFIDNNTGIYMSQFYDSNAMQTFQADMGGGFYVHQTDGLSCQSSVTASYTIYGYYVPAGAVPPS